MNRTMDRLNHTTSLPKISEITDITNQNAYIPKKYKKIPKKIVRQPIEFAFSGLDVKLFKLRTNKNSGTNYSCNKVGKSLHERKDSQQFAQTLLSFSSKEGNMERKII